MTRKAFIFSVLALIILCTTYRIFTMDVHGFWFDERMTIQRIHGIQEPDMGSDTFTSDKFFNDNNPVSVIKCTNNQNSGNNVLYNLFLHFWIGIFGAGETTVRLVSILFWLLSLFIIFHISKLAFPDRKTLPWLSVLVLAFHPLFMEYSEEAKFGKCFFT